MAKDLTTMPTEKLWKRMRDALAEIERRQAQPGGWVAQPQRAQEGPRWESSPTDPRTIEATLQRRLTRPHLPKPDPAYLAAFERTRPREPVAAPIDTEGMTAPGPSEPAE